MRDYEHIYNKGGTFFLNMSGNSFKKKNIISNEYVVVKRDFWWPLKKLLNKVGFKFSFKYTLKPKDE